MYILNRCSGLQIKLFKGYCVRFMLKRMSGHTFLYRKIVLPGKNCGLYNALKKTEFLFKIHDKMYVMSYRFVFSVVINV